MLELLWQLAIFFLGMSIGKVRATNTDITNQTSYMQELIDQAYIERDKYRMTAMAAENLAETWKRRYDGLLDYVKEINDNDQTSIQVPNMQNSNDD